MIMTKQPQPFAKVSPKLSPPAIAPSISKMTSIIITAVSIILITLFMKQKYLTI